MKSKILLKLLSLLGFSTVAASCEFIGAAEYGCPSADYVFNVDVKDAETNAPIEGMRVSAIVRHTGEYYNPTTGGYDTERVDTLAWELTNEQGKVTLSMTDFPVSLHEIAADDIDGAENGGHYSTVSTEVTTERDDYKNPGDWYSGKATHNVTLKTTKLSE